MPCPFTPNALNGNDGKLITLNDDGNLDTLAGQVVKQKPVPARKKVHHAPYTAIKDQNASIQVQ